MTRRTEVSSCTMFDHLELGASKIGRSASEEKLLAAVEEVLD